MGNALQDQLLKAGLVNKSKAHQAKKKQQKQKRAGKKTAADEARLQAEKARAEKAARDKALNQQRQAEAEQRAIAAQIQQLIEMNRIADSEGELAYNFTDGTLIKRLYVTETIQQRLGSGQVAIIREGEGYALVPKAVAAKIAERDESMVVDLGEPTHEAVDEEDPYAEFQVPDDLMW